MFKNFEREGCAIKVYILSPIHRAGVEWISARAKTVLWSDDEVNNWPADADAVIIRGTNIRRADLAQAANLKVVGKHGIGVDNIDLNAAKDLGIRVVNTPHENVESVAELAVAFMLALSRRLPVGHESLKMGTALPAGRVSLADNFIGNEMLSKSIGIIGMGKIGQRVAEILTAAFRMKCYGFDPYFTEERWSKNAVKVQKCDTVEKLIAASDYVSIHVPLTPETENLIGPSQFNHFKTTAYLINTARGGIVDETALYGALVAKKLQGAGLDVFEKDPPDQKNPLFSLPNFMGMPHMGASTKEALERMSLAVVQEVFAVLIGDQPRYPVV